MRLVNELYRFERRVFLENKRFSDDDLNIQNIGLDCDSRPILVLCADNLPNPDIYDYDLILS